MKRLIFVSTGRCGTTRISQILREKLPESFSVVHQMRFSRLANIAAHIMLFTGESNLLKRRLYALITAKYIHTDNYISSDPLTAMILPDELIRSKDVHIIHVFRDAPAFALSIHRFSRTRLKSFIAHNFIPFWQPGIFPLENIISSRILMKYENVAKIKNEYFEKKYTSNSNYKKIHMNELFNSNILNQIIRDAFGKEIFISREDLETRAN